MAIKLKLTDRQQKLAADEIDESQPIGDEEALSEAGFEFEDVDAEEEAPEGDDGIEPSGEYIEEEPPEGEAGATDASSGWVDDSVREYATSYGLNDDDLKQFSSFEDLERFGTLIDRRLAEAAETNKEEAGDPEPEKPQGLLDQLELLDRSEFEKANYGDNELALVDRLNRVIETVQKIAPAIERQQEAQLQEQQKVVEDAFHRTLDDLDPVFFGRYFDGEKVNKDLAQPFQSNRQQVREVMERLEAGIIADAKRLGQEPKIPPIHTLAHRAAKIAAGIDTPEPGADGISKKEVAKQSRRRRPVGTGGTKGGRSRSTSSKGNSEDDEVQALVNNPEIARFYRQAQKANGAI